MTRNPWIDQVKGVACLLIVCHHLAFYGPMTNVLEPFIGGTLSWFKEYARMVVQVFLVLGGYFAAAALTSERVVAQGPIQAILAKRYVRLVAPYSVVLVMTILITELVRSWGFNHPSMSSPATFAQFGAHLLLLQGILGWESLSAGVWYVAIDFQLFVLAAVWFQAARFQWNKPGWPASGSVDVFQIGIVLLTLTSLWLWNRSSSLDIWALYFFGAYGLGMLSWWTAHEPRVMRRFGWGLLMLVLIGVALALEWRDRIALAGITAVSLAWGPSVPWPQSIHRGLLLPLQRLGQMSYSIFIVHFGASLLVNAIVHLLWPASVLANALGVVCAVLLSIGAGALLYRWVESKGVGAIPLFGKFMNKSHLI